MHRKTTMKSRVTRPLQHVVTISVEAKTYLSVATQRKHREPCCMTACNEFSQGNQH